MDDSLPSDVYNQAAGQLSTYYAIDGSNYKLKAGKKNKEDAERINEILRGLNHNYLVGGQHKIEPWTRPYKSSPSGYFTNTQRTVYNAVAYDWGGMDSPGDFNLDMKKQAKALTASGQSQTREDPTLAPNNTLDPPYSDWRNYIKIDGTGGNNAISVGTRPGQYQPFRPCLNVIDHNHTRWYQEDLGEEVNSNVHKGYNYNRLKYSAGTDCNGMIQRAASYSGNIYVYGNGKYNLEHRVAWDGSISSKAFPTKEAFSTEINITHIAIDRTNLSFIVPGDFVVCPGHFVMIYKIEYFTGTRKTRPNGDMITVIEEMTSTDAEYCARNDRKLDTWASVGLYRLKVISQ